MLASLSLGLSPSLSLCGPSLLCFCLSIPSTHPSTHSHLFARSLVHSRTTATHARPQARHWCSLSFTSTRTHQPVHARISHALILTLTITPTLLNRTLTLPHSSSHSNPPVTLTFNQFLWTRIQGTERARDSRSRHCRIVCPWREPSSTCMFSCPISSAHQVCVETRDRRTLDSGQEDQTSVAPW